MGCGSQSEYENDVIIIIGALYILALSSYRFCSSIHCWSWPFMVALVKPYNLEWVLFCKGKVPLSCWDAF